MRMMASTAAAAPPSGSGDAIPHFSVAVDEETGLIPYYILDFADGKSKALFLVPSSLVSRLTVHPILCRGSTFSLHLDANQSIAPSVGIRHHEESSSSDIHNNFRNDSPSAWSSSSSTTAQAAADATQQPRTAFLSIEYESPYPEAVALEIAKRLTKRVFEETTSSSSSPHDAAMILGL